ncbi:MAG: ferritin-like domain-containing protein [Gordonia sp. (in: high G+C Gram-positive bacteria)]|uniref:ferritin-like domain-containing protein n=1 Tax=Gordonia sp. (in: high G+C Gram-positive bacteria) TaxID=84139 RepID=UPI0039E245DA
MTADTDALDHAADAESAAIFAYGVTTAFIGSGERGTVAEFIAAHRVRRDSLNRDLVSLGADEQVAAAGYRLPEKITDPTTAAGALLTAEEECARAYRAMAEQVSSRDLRRRAVDGLTECAKRAAHWRGVLKRSPVTVAFPGAAKN